MFFLWCAVTGEFDTDWHTSHMSAKQHAKRCSLGADWRVVQLSDAQIAEVFAVRS